MNDDDIELARIRLECLRLACNCIDICNNEPSAKYVERAQTYADFVLKKDSAEAAP